MDNIISKNISTARVICILSLVYVHFPPFFGEIVEIHSFTEYLATLISNVIGRNSVPLLSVISGYLIVKTFYKYDFKLLLKNKILTLLIPLVTWNCISFIKDLVINSSTIENINALNYFFAIYDTPGIVPLYFLRDIFICVMLTPALIYISTTLNTKITILTLTLLSIFITDSYIFINDAILVFFFVGIVIAKKNINLKIFEGKYITFICLLCLLTIINIRIYITQYDSDIYINTALTTFARFFGAIVFWNIACFLSKTTRIMKHSSIIFFTFCSHTIIIEIMWRIALRCDITSMSYTYLGLFIISPVLVFIISQMIYKVMMVTFPKIEIMLTGKRSIKILDSKGL
ncbi:acyltransferase [Shewanella vesiculosa]|uniref:acyltransferase family protein n=1 Tax=Shewanella vesiculosa TaxID=518738 RepID=UPI000F503A5C|nr:acyltransferase [Shewanella vesiculosa]RPA55079.1 acyltransferase [Shewanella vesiculosa]UJL44075.1 acyltransferase [Shewanella vesiculosa]